ncbi:MBOAT family O-acyltransferase [Lachnospiraceae bacterium C1.1]|nr:MBOAT family O-acyltransferase [Lachnospiraceae bacterium C1.1]
MLFNTLDFLFFLPLVFALYWVCSERIRWIVLLMVSWYFYISLNPQYFPILLFTTFISWAAGIAMNREDSQNRKKNYLILSVVVSLAFLLFFKYFNFMTESAAAIANCFGLKMQPYTLKLVQPAGISFYTFMTVSYLADVYKGKMQAQTNFAKYALHISFFPQVIAGPIGRAPELMDQFFAKRAFDPEKAESGLRMMLWGYFKKLIVADSLSIYVDNVYRAVPYYFGMTFIITSIMYTFQIYCDFSGYSDIAIGVARLFNIDLMSNFKSPYFSRSIREFWSRWHISLSTWFRDYVYIPLGGSRKGEFKKNRNQLITMLVSGLWHGADWTFVIWGGLHGIYQIIEGLFRKIFVKKENADKERPKALVIASDFFHWAITFAMVDIAWIFFRADSISDAFFIVTHMHNGVILHFANAWTKMMVDMDLTVVALLEVFAAIAALMIYDFISLKHDISTELGKIKLPIRWLIYVALTSLIVISELHGGTSQTFIYFNF